MAALAIFVSVSICVSVLAGIRWPLQFIVHTLTSQHVQITHPFTQLAGISQHSVVEFYFEVDTGTSRTIIGFSDFAAEANVEFDWHKFSFG